MAESVLNVFMDGVFCGRVHQTSSGNLRFVYDEEYCSNPYSTPLSVSMPLAVPEYPKRVILPFLEGLITDSEQGRRALAARYQVNPTSQPAADLILNAVRSLPAVAKLST